MRNAKKTLGFSMAAKWIDGYDTPEGGCIRREISINKPLRVSQTQEQAGLGAAIAAGVGAGVYHDLETGCRAAVRYQDDIVLPDAKRHETYRQLFELYKEAAIRNQHILDQLAAIGRNSEHTRKSLEMK